LRRSSFFPSASLALLRAVLISSIFSPFSFRLRGFATSLAVLSRMVSTTLRRWVRRVVPVLVTSTIRSATPIRGAISAAPVRLTTSTSTPFWEK
jgi:hypothetical protein